MSKIEKLVEHVSAALRDAEVKETGSSNAKSEEITKMIKKNYLLPNGRICKYCWQERYEGKDGKMHFGAVKPLSWEKFLEISNDPRLQQWQDEIRLLQEKYPQGGDDYEAEKKAIKSNFPLRTEHGFAFAGDMHRTNDNALWNRECMYDNDSFAERHQDVNIREWLQNKMTPDFIDQQNVHLAYLSVSGKGFHICFGLRKGETIAGGQLRINRALGLADDEYDSQVFEACRGSYFVHKSYWIVEPKEEDWYFTDLKEALAANEEGKRVLSYANNNTPKAVNNTQHQALVLSGNMPETYNGAKWEHIVRCLINSLGGEPEKGKRHDMYGTLCGYLHGLVNNNPTWLYNILPEWNDFDEQFDQCEYACNQDNTGRPAKVVTAAISAAKEMTKREKYDFNSLSLPPLNPLQKLILSKVPQQYHAQALLLEMAIEGALLHHCNYDWINGDPRSFVFGVTVVGAPASGKSFYKSFVELLKTPLYDHDLDQKQQQDEYKEKLKMTKNSGKQPVDPKVYLANILPDTTLAKLAYYIENADGDTMFMQCDEIDELTRTEASKLSTKKVLYRLSYDSCLWGQDRAGLDSVTASGIVKICNLWNGTPLAVERFFDRNEVEDGLCSRQVFCLMPKIDLFDIPRFVPYTKNEQDRIKDIAYELYSTQGHFSAPLVAEAIDQWLQDKKLEYANENEYFMQYAIRAAEYGMKAGLAYSIIDGSALKGNKSRNKGTVKEKNAVEYALWYAESTFRNAMVLFIDKIRRLSATSVVSNYGGKYCPKRLYHDLNTTFTDDDIEQLQDQHNWHPSIANIKYTWKQNGKIVENEDGSYTKIK